MKLTPYNKNDLVIRRPKSDNFGLLSEFVNGGLECAKVEGYPHHDATTCATSLRQSIKRYGFLGITVAKRGDDVYLVKK